MIVECYTADVYCDVSDHDIWEIGSRQLGKPLVCTGKNQREAHNHRRLFGFVKVRGNDVCPLCAKRGRDGVKLQFNQTGE